MSQHERNTKDHELKIFRHFCECAGLIITTQDIDQPSPPKPDICVEVKDLGRCYFELVRLDPVDQLIRVKAISPNRILFTEFRKYLCPADAEQFLAHFRNASITVLPSTYAGTRELKKCLPELARILVHKSDDKGFTLTNRKDQLPAAIDRITVSWHEDFDGPVFNTGTAGYVLRLNLEALVTKLERKDYVVDAPLHLLAYIELGEVSHLTDEEEIPKIIENYFSESMFKRVWLFEQLQLKVRDYGSH